MNRWNFDRMLEQEIISSDYPDRIAAAPTTAVTLTGQRWLVRDCLVEQALAVSPLGLIAALWETPFLSTVHPEVCVADGRLITLSPGVRRRVSDGFGPLGEFSVSEVKQNSDLLDGIALPGWKNRQGEIWSSLYHCGQVADLSEERRMELAQGLLSAALRSMHDPKAGSRMPAKLRRVKDRICREERKALRRYVGEKSSWGVEAGLRRFFRLPAQSVASPPEPKAAGGVIL